MLLIRRTFLATVPFLVDALEAAWTFRAERDMKDAIFAGGLLIKTDAGVGREQHL